MSVPSFDLLPPFQEETNFLLPTDQRCESSWLRDIKATVDTAFSEYLVHFERLGHTSQGLLTQRFTGKIAFYEAIGGFTDGKGIRLSQSLNSRRDVGCFSQGKLLLSPRTAHFTDYDETRVYPYPDGEMDTFGLLQTLIQVSQGSKNSQPSPYCSLRIVFMSLGVAKIHQESIPRHWFSWMGMAKCR